MGRAKANQVILREIQFDESQYPRPKWSQDTVNLYRMVLDKLPPITITPDKFIIDGYHRYLAHTLEKRETIPAITVDIPRDQIMWEGARANAANAKQLSSEEKAMLARIFVKQGKAVKDIAECLAVSEDAVYNWAGKILRQKKDERNAHILELYLRCYPEQQIAKEVGLKRQAINAVIATFSQNQKNGNPPSSLQVFNIWEFGQPDDSYGDSSFPGIMPGQVVENLLWYYTEPFDLVVDLMAGGGTTIDVCLTMQRRILAYDLLPTRPAEIKKHDIVTGLPRLPLLRSQGKVIRPKLLILDPPYGDQMKGDYSTHDSNLANMPMVQYHHQLAKTIDRAYSYIAPDGYVALILGQTRKENILVDHILSIWQRLKRPWQIVERIIVPYTTEQAEGYHMAQARESKFMLRRYRDLIILRRGL